MKLDWHSYSYYPYEKVLATREVEALLGVSRVDDAGGVQPQRSDPVSAQRLTYFSGFTSGSDRQATTQALLEAAARSGKNRQATRYSVHGLHEYKGKFNPQVAKALLNIFNVQQGDRVLDPFCGSGTTLVEAAQLGAEAYGTDVNPLAVYIANAKLLALGEPAKRLNELVDGILATMAEGVRNRPTRDGEARAEYLRLWFDRHVLDDIETLRHTTETIAGRLAPILLTIASDLLREYSQQEPKDLRIRRRTTPIPAEPLIGRWERECRRRIERLAAAQAVLGRRPASGRAELRPAIDLSRQSGAAFDAAITSPPYAMALPYIDTQRLSLVWLGLLEPANILQLEAELIGSRETRGTKRGLLTEKMRENVAALPMDEANLCLEMQASLGDSDGFRRRAVPGLLYRYFGAMAETFRAVRSAMAPAAPFALIVGHNHTVLGGRRFDIDTPRHLANLASASGWVVEELLPLQTYRRYGLHASNAVTAETMLLLRNGPHSPGG